MDLVVRVHLHPIQSRIELLWVKVETALVGMEMVEKVAIRRVEMSVLEAQTVTRTTTIHPNPPTRTRISPPLPLPRFPLLLKRIRIPIRIKIKVHQIRIGNLHLPELGPLLLPTLQFQSHQPPPPLPLVTLLRFLLEIPLLPKIQIQPLQPFLHPRRITRTLNTSKPPMPARLPPLMCLASFLKEDLHLNNL